MPLDQWPQKIKSIVHPSPLCTTLLLNLATLVSCLKVFPLTGVAAAGTQTDAGAAMAAALPTCVLPPGLSLWVPRRVRGYGGALQRRWSQVSHAQRERTALVASPARR